MERDRFGLIVFDYFKIGGIESVSNAIENILLLNKVKYKVIGILNSSSKYKSERFIGADWFNVNNIWLNRLYNRTIRTIIIKNNISASIIDLNYLILTNIFQLTYISEPAIKQKKVILWCHGIEVWNSSNLLKFSKKLTRLFQPKKLPIEFLRFVK